PWSARPRRGVGARRDIPHGLGRFPPEERPAHRVAVDEFWVDAHPETSAAFGRFVEATGYVTVARRPLGRWWSPSRFPADGGVRGRDPAGPRARRAPGDPLSLWGGILP